MTIVSRYITPAIAVIGVVFAISSSVQAQGLFSNMNETRFSQSQIDSAPVCGRFPADQDEYLCNCEAGFGSGGVWGSGPYTTDSNICAAAQHSGVITEDGGVIFTTATGPQEEFKGSDSYGVQTSNWGSYDNSFIVQPALVSSQLDECSVLPSGVDELVCSCEADTGLRGGVWGSGPYTSDSNICAAARHAGYLGPDAGIVNVLRIRGLENYKGSEWNDVSSFDWGPSQSSLVFDGN